MPERTDQSRDVVRERPAVVSARRLVRVAVTAQVHRDRPVTEIGEGGELVTPRPPQVGEAVHEHHERCVRVVRAGFDGMETDAVGVDVSMRPRSGIPDRGRVGDGH